MEDNEDDDQKMLELLKSRDARFFQANLSQDRIPASFATLLESYSDIPRDEQVTHILQVRDEAYNRRPYPCLGRFRFLDLDLASHPLYHDYVLPQLRSKQTNSATSTSTTITSTSADATTTTSSRTTASAFENESLAQPVFLDLGTCLGQDIRKLIYDGARVEYLYGADLDSSFVDIGYSLFRDEEKLPRSHFLTGPSCDVLAEASPSPQCQGQKELGLSELDGTIDILNATAIFHLFDLENQKRVARRCLGLLRKPPTPSSSSSSSGEGKGRKCLILGGQAGNVNSGESLRGHRDSHKRFRHDVASWREMWESVVSEDEWKALGTKVDVWSQLYERGWTTGDSGTTSVNEQELQNEGDGRTEWNSKIVGSALEGHRWHVYSVWVEFGK